MYCDHFLAVHVEYYCSNRLVIARGFNAPPVASRTLRVGLEDRDTQSAIVATRYDNACMVAVLDLQFLRWLGSACSGSKGKKSDDCSAMC